jgi:hypothetical protein
MLATTSRRAEDESLANDDFSIIRLIAISNSHVFSPLSFLKEKKQVCVMNVVTD